MSAEAVSAPVWLRATPRKDTSWHEKVNVQICPCASCVWLYYLSLFVQPACSLHTGASRSGSSHAGSLLTDEKQSCSWRSRHLCHTRRRCSWRHRLPDTKCQRSWSVFFCLFVVVFFVVVVFRDFQTSIFNKLDLDRTKRTVILFFIPF